MEVTSNVPTYICPTLGHITCFLNKRQYSAVLEGISTSLSALLYNKAYTLVNRGTIERPASLVGGLIIEYKYYGVERYAVCEPYMYIRFVVSNKPV